MVGAYVDLTGQRTLEDRAYQKGFQLEINRRLMEHIDQKQGHVGQLLQEGPVQTLSGLGFTLQLARQLFPDPEALKMLEEIRDSVKNMISELRDLSNELRPPALARFGLERAIRSYVSQFQEKNPGTQVNMTASGGMLILPDATVAAIYHVVEESLSNIANHAQATVVDISLSIEPHQVLLEIKDNGRGFNYRSDWMGLTVQGCYGLVRMKDCMESIGGALYVQSTPNSGTRVFAEIPLAVE